MQSLFHLLPFSAYYANLACHLRDLWIGIETQVEHIIPNGDDKHMDAVIKQAEDANETLFYI